MKLVPLKANTRNPWIAKWIVSFPQNGASVRIKAKQAMVEIFTRMITRAHAGYLSHTITVISVVV